MGERTIMGNSRETVSDMLRRCADESEARCISPFAIACEKLGIDTSLGYVKCERSVYRRMAGAIDCELAMARLEGNGAYGTLREFMRVYSILLEKPMSDDEDLGGWLERWFVPKPVGDDGEPVQLGDTVVDKLRGEMLVTRMSWVGKGVYFNDSHSRRGKKLRTSRSLTLPASASGVPIRKCSTPTACPSRWAMRYIGKDGMANGAKERYLALTGCMSQLGKTIPMWRPPCTSTIWTGCQITGSPTVNRTA